MNYYIRKQTIITRLLAMCAAMLLTITLTTPALGANSRGQQSVDELLRELDDVVAHKSQYVNARLRVIKKLDGQIKTSRDTHEKLDLYNQLYTQLNSFNADSALLTAQRWLALARRAGDRNSQRCAELSLAETYSKSGMFKEATDITHHIQQEQPMPQLNTFLYHVLRSTYDYMMEFSINPTQTAHYKQQADHFRDTILTLYQPSSRTYAIVKAGEYNEHKQPQRALQLLERFLGGRDTTAVRDPIFTYTVAETYLLKGDTENAKRYLLYSAIDDLKKGTREYLSLIKISLLLYNEGDIGRAYTYFQTCLDDAQASNSRLRIVEILRIFPEVNKAYQQKISNQRLREHLFLGFISLLSVALLTGLVVIYRSIKRQKELNLQLRQSNDELMRAYHAVTENSRVKEVYIGRYMTQCSAYIDKLAQYRSSLIKIINTGVVKDLVAKIRSTIDLDDELKEFYTNFDETFLQLFPTFVADFNSLLQPQCHIVLKKEGQLNTELRIFALIRLGITDSVRIAQFLRYSVTTIYNYRTRTRNKALGDRNQFEARVMEIGKIKE